MKKKWVLSQESFDALLKWLDSDREQAGQKYQDIRERLVKIFTCRGCGDAEDLADETIDRVIKRLDEIDPVFKGERAPYFYGVANKVHLEYLRRKPVVPTAISVDTNRLEQECACLEDCIGKLSQESRDLVLQYYRGEGRARIEQRRQMADNLGIAPNALRIRAFRIRESLEECVEKCVERISE